MNLQPLAPILPLAALVAAFTACQPAMGGEPDTDVAAPVLVSDDASLAWSVQLDEDWSPTHAVAVGDVVVVSSSWEIDEGTAITAYDADGSVLWQESAYGGALLAPVGYDQVLICDSEKSWTVATSDGSLISDGAADDERCPVADDEAGNTVPRNDEAYTVKKDRIVVDGPRMDYDVALDQPVDEIWGVDAGILTFVDKTDTIQLYR